MSNPPASPASDPVPPTAPASALRPVPFASPRPWAGVRLAAAGDGTGELWLAGPDLAAGTPDGATLDQVAAARGEPFLGSAAVRRYGARFPLIVKLIDAADWLSLQVHPDDEGAVRWRGEGSVGKAEAWLVLAADPGTRLITGPRPDVPVDELRAAIADGTLGRAGCEERDAVPGDTLMLHPGTLHAIGGGSFIYEIEQPSDITFRVSDWGRPAAPGRGLHREESLATVEPSRHAEPAGTGFALDGGALVTPDFRLELLGPGEGRRAPGGRSLEVVTALAGTVELRGEGWAETLSPYETVVVPASCAGYALVVSAGGRAAVGSLG